MTNIQELMQQARDNPAKPVIEGLLHESETAGLHGPPEVFKTMLALQMAESLATGSRLLGTWVIPKPVTVYFFETEMSVPALGSRLARMFANRTPPTRVHFADDARLREFRRAFNLQEKFSLLNAWIAEVAADVTILDTCNPFFRGKESPNDETMVGAFFDLLDALPSPTKLFVRHNHKQRIEDCGLDPATKIRGSGQFADVPDLLIELSRLDKRTHQAQLSVSKFRHGTKPEDLTLWFDSGDFRLIAIPPVIHVLQTGPLSRPELLNALKTRFDLGQRKADEMIAEHRVFSVERMDGHRKVFEIDWDAVGQAEWFARIERPIERGKDMQGCINLPVPLETPSLSAFPLG